MPTRVTYRKPAGKARRGSEAGRLATSCNAACGLSVGSPEGAGERRAQGVVAGSLFAMSKRRRRRLALRPALPRRAQTHGANKPYPGMLLVLDSGHSRLARGLAHEHGWVAPGALRKQ